MGAYSPLRSLSTARYAFGASKRMPPGRTSTTSQKVAERRRFMSKGELIVKAKAVGDPVVPPI